MVVVEGDRDHGQDGMGWLRASQTYAVVLLGELDDAVQDVQQPFPEGEAAEGSGTHLPWPRGRLAELCPPSCSCLGLEPIPAAQGGPTGTVQDGLPTAPGSPLGWGRQSPAFPTNPWALDGKRESRWGIGARVAPGLGATALRLLGFDVEVFPQRDVPNGLASADGEHQRHHVGVKAW